MTERGPRINTMWERFDGWLERRRWGRRANFVASLVALATFAAGAVTSVVGALLGADPVPLLVLGVGTFALVLVAPLRLLRARQRKLRGIVNLLIGELGYAQTLLSSEAQAGEYRHLSERQAPSSTWAAHYTRLSERLTPSACRLTERAFQEIDVLNHRVIDRLIDDGGPVQVEQQDGLPAVVSAIDKAIVALDDELPREKSRRDT
jgi:hypothetical protein